MVAPIVEKIIAKVLRNKLATALSVLVFAFIITIIALSVQKSDTKDDYNQCIREKDQCNAQLKQATAPTIVPPTTTPEPLSSTLEPKPKIDYRLPKTVLPDNYKLYLHPDLTTDDQFYKGTNEITLKVVEKTKQITLHAHSTLTVDKVELFKGKEALKIENILFDAVTDFLTINLANEIDIGKDYSLILQFSGTLKDKLIGFYSSTYIDSETQEGKKIATSKFEPTYARQAYPCFDEPAMKATYDVSLVRPSSKEYHALSNMPMIEIVDYPNNEELKIVNFKKSEPMSTYLACYIVSDFVYETFDIPANEVGKNILMRVYSAPSQKDKIKFAGETGAKAIGYYLEYFEIAYPLPKLDMVAIPDFVSGAMEHWGLVTFRETALLYDEKISSTANKKRIALVVAHELAHMWFGNLVTMAWWNELWLNEGFASYMEYKCIQIIVPSFGVLDQFTVDELHPVLNLDATLSSHPIVQTVENPDQITEIFDTITYNKGASVLRMIEDFIGEDDFRKSVSNYLKNHKFGNAETTDLLKEMEAIKTDLDVTPMVNTWIRQKGYPYVTVATVPDERNKYKLTQKRFLTDPESYKKNDIESEFNYLWTIPLTYFTDTDVDTIHRTLFQWDSSEVTITIDKDHNWIKFNKDQIGYYRVLYPDAMWTSFTKEIKENNSIVSIVDRAHLIDDAFSFAEAQLIPYDTALEITQILSVESEYVPWAVAASKLSKIKNLIFYTEVYEPFRDYVVSIVDTAYKEVNTDVINPDDSEHLKNLLRTTIFDLACGMGHKECLEDMSTKFTQWIMDETSIPHPDIRSTVYYYGMYADGKPENWEILWKRFSVELDATEKSKMMSALSAIRDPVILNKFITLAKTQTDVIRSQDYFTCLQNIASNRIGEPLVWDFVRNEWDYIVERFTLNDRYLGSMVKSITSRFTTKIKLTEMNDFFAKYPDAGAGTTARAQALEAVQNNINWLDRNLKKLTEWLEKQKTNQP